MEQKIKRKEQIKKTYNEIKEEGHADVRRI